MPVLACGHAQNRGAADVGLDERKRVEEGTVDVRLGREVDDRIDAACQLVDKAVVADVALDEPVAPLSLEPGEVARHAGVHELVEDQNLYVMPCRGWQAHD